MRLIVADASPLIMLARSNLLEALAAIAGDIIVPEAVWHECTGDAGRAGARALIAAAHAGKLYIRSAPIWVGARPLALGEGEVSAIALALELQSPALIDERLARKVASMRGVPVVGSAAILLAAKQRGMIAEVRPILEDWRAAGYFLAPPLLNSVLARAGET
jgi:uncharacterized protein